MGYSCGRLSGHPRSPFTSGRLAAIGEPTETTGSVRGAVDPAHDDEGGMYWDCVVCGAPWSFGPTAEPETCLMCSLLSVGRADCFGRRNLAVRNRALTPFVMELINKLFDSDVAAAFLEDSDTVSMVARKLDRAADGNQDGIADLLKQVANNLDDRTADWLVETADSPAAWLYSRI